MRFLLAELLSLTFMLFASCMAQDEVDDLMSSEDSFNSTFVTVTVDKLDISHPPQPCCSTLKQRNCEMCEYECTLLMIQNTYEQLIAHRFNCSITNAGTPMQIPVIRPITANKIKVLLYVVAPNGDRLVSGEAQLQTGNLKYAPNSSAFRVSYMDRYMVEFNVSVVCLEGFAGPHCNISCPTPTANDHYECAHQGKVCLSGWMGDDCKTPICVNGCGSGICISPGQCRCPLGWEGARCSECVTKVGCQNGYCTDQPGQCKCFPGYTGTLCNVQSFNRCIGSKCAVPTREPVKPAVQTPNESVAQFRTSAFILLIVCVILVVLVVVLLLRSCCPVQSPFRRIRTEKLTPI